MYHQMTIKLESVFTIETWTPSAKHTLAASMSPAIKQSVIFDIRVKTFACNNHEYEINDTWRRLVFVEICFADDLLLAEL